jgi:hypothetical protein
MVFYDLSEDDIIRGIVSRSIIIIFGALKFTFLVLIPNKDNIESFEDFKPISLQIYKIIEKLISLWVNVITSKAISHE